MAIFYNQDLLYAKSNRKILGAQKTNARGLFQYFLPHPSSVSCINVYVMHQTLGIESWYYEKMAYEKPFTN